jgi:hypothetical protein
MILEFDPDYIQEAEELGIKVRIFARNGHRIEITNWHRRCIENYIMEETYPILGYDLDSETPDAVLSWMTDGTYFFEKGEHPLDLVYMEVS